MVTVSAFEKRQNQDGESFMILILQGDLEIIQSQTTGNFYATAKKCSISTTFTEQIAAAQVGKQLPGRIIKQLCDPYNYVIPDTGESIEMQHQWVYDPIEEVSKVSHEVLKAASISFSKNGKLVTA